MKYLLISHNAFSNNNANGRVLSSLFSEIEEKNIAQLFIQSETPTTRLNASFYRITDGDRLYGFFKSATGTELSSTFFSNNSFQTNEKNLVKKSSFRTSSIAALIRQFVWKKGKIDYKPLFRWIRGFKPNVIVFQSGRTPFLCELVKMISLHFNLPVILFSTEDEYFHPKKPLNIFHNWHLSILRKAYRSLSERVICQILIQDELREMYRAEFKKPSYTIMMGSSLEDNRNLYQKNNSATRFLYAGNIDRGRHKQILEIANSLGKISNNVFKLEVIPSGVTKRIISKLRKNSHIVLKQYLPFSKYVQELQTSDVLFFVDSFSNKYKNIIKETFTGKTADYLSTGNIIYVYSPEYVYTTKYFKSNPGTAIVATNKSELNITLEKLINGEYNLTELRNNCIKLFLKNHDNKTNAIKFKNIVEEAVNGNEKNPSN